MSNKHMWWAWTLKEIVNIVCWISLAIIFEHWWIALFAIFFTSSCSSESKPSEKKNENSSTVPYGDIDH